MTAELSCSTSHHPSQTRLHDGLCKRRRAATVATHDLQKINPPVAYKCGAASDISMQPLGWGETISVEQFLERVRANKPDRGGGKKAKHIDTAVSVLNKCECFVCLWDHFVTISFSSASSSTLLAACCLPPLPSPPLPPPPLSLLLLFLFFPFVL